MGQEANCAVRFGDKAAEGKALLETDHLLFKSDQLRLKIRFSTMGSVDANAGELRIGFAEGTAVFELGSNAQKWAHKILHPKTLLDKLGVKPGMKVSVAGIDDARFVADLRERAGAIAGEDEAGADIAFVAVDGPGDLERLATLKGGINRHGAIWAVFRKGRKDFNENDVLRGGIAAGLVDVKVVRFSDTHTASKFVIRKSER